MGRSKSASDVRTYPAGPIVLIMPNDGVGPQQRQLSQELHDGLGGQILVLAKSSCLPVRLADFKNHVSVDFSPEFTRYEPGTANAADLLHGPL